MKLRCPAGYLWTPAEDRKLREILIDGRGADGAAAALGRTKSAVIRRAFKLRVSIGRKPSIAHKGDLATEVENQSQD